MKNIVFIFLFMFVSNFAFANNLNIGNKINRYNKYTSTPTKTQNKIVLPIGLSQRKYSINKVNRKYKSPKPTKRIIPLINSFI